MDNKNVCLFCQKPLPANAHKIQKYCSKEHMWRMNNLRKKKISTGAIKEIAKNDAKGNCHFCNKKIDVNKKFCDLAHWNLFRYYKGKGYTRKEIFNIARDIENRKETGCVLCGKSLDSKNRKAKFCSKKHYRFFQYHLEKGLTVNTVKAIFNDSIK